MSLKVIKLRPKTYASFSARCQKAKQSADFLAYRTDAWERKQVTKKKHGHGKKAFNKTQNPLPFVAMDFSIWRFFIILAYWKSWLNEFGFIHCYYFEALPHALQKKILQNFFGIFKSFDKEDFRIISLMVFILYS